MRGILLSMTTARLPAVPDVTETEMKFVRMGGQALAALLLTVVCAGGARAQVPEDLAGRKDFKALRSSSADPTGGNADMRRMAPGETLTVADIKGAGRITHLWFTIAAPSKDHLRELVIRIVWDDAAKPAVECPIGDFFAQGHGGNRQVRQRGGERRRADRAGDGYWPMPFKKHAVITVTNEGAERFTPTTTTSTTACKRARIAIYATSTRNITTISPPRRGSPLTICDVKKAPGHFVGTVEASLLFNKQRLVGRRQRQCGR